jgi:c-di-GMP phosphodiesterase
MAHACLARQPIYDRELAVRGYELLYRSAPDAGGAGAEGSVEAAMSAATLTAAFTDIGLDEIVGVRSAWVNVDTAFLLDGLTDVLTPGRVVVEILESVAATPEIVDAVEELKQLGFEIALDDFSYRPDLAPLLRLADVVKVDVLAHGGEELERQVETLGGQGVTLLAEKVETYEMLSRCQGLGFALFQGYFLNRPRPITSANASLDAVSRVQLVARLGDPELGFDELAGLIAADPALSYRLLRYINSAYVGLRTPLSSLREALITLGLRRVRSWASLLLISDIGQDRKELVLTALLRARMCEALAPAVACDPDEAYLAGLLSVVDALVDRPLREAVDLLPVSEHIHDALLDRDGPLGRLLERALAFERGNFDGAPAGPLTEADVAQAYVEGIRSAHRLTEGLGG